ncbi:cobalamin biosynthesis protein [Aquihabitans sp. G128]|uniref:cobalamin biosynthesis protein CobD/CbiB n=1 Tax=Aquihabitans sp. G128 TaxID=2849779 RepID=UPI001C212A46|nr:CobD/CbiB family cobalamin biosynthesis protein [Aquihabitans sp. G128]QXC59198.1 cobalamin biosynthesis protein [Aquihabitans sp. G128]
MSASTWPGRSAAAAAGIVADRLLGEPPVRPHPVSLFGRLMRASEARLWADRRGPGVAHAAFGVGVGAAVGRSSHTVAGSTYLAVAGRALDEAAADVEAALLADDLDRARELLPALVGRDPSTLDAGEIARAVIESLAENTIDAVVAPALWAVVAGGAGALGYRAINTLDAMVGHRNERYERFGWASARLDDAANWVPARVGAAVVVLVRPSSAAAVARAVRHDAPGHPSPNGGVIEAAFAAALGLRLGGESRYGERVELRPTLGDGKPPAPGDIAAARRLARDVDLALAALLAAPALARAARQPARAGARARPPHRSVGKARRPTTRFPDRTGPAPSPSVLSGRHVAPRRDLPTEPSPRSTGEGPT